MAQRIATFLAGATQTLDVAIYDLRLDASPGGIVLAAFEDAVKRGVHVRLMFNQDHPGGIPDPPPSEIDWAFVDRLKAMGVETKPIPGVPDLMHHKYVVRDVGTPQATVLTGSTNWTNDSWTREENVIFTLASADAAATFTQNFAELWQNPVVAQSGRFSPPWQALADGTRVRIYFCPGRGLKLVHAMSRSLASAQRRIRICSPVLTSGPILGTIAEMVEHGGVDVSGVYDATQMDEVQHQWGSQATTSWKIGAFHSIISAVHFGSKRSTPYAIGSVHDFMHAKILVADDYVYAGSFNLSHSGEQNAENVVQIESHTVAELCAAYIDRVAARYGGRPLTGT
ncbi:MAG TPA: phosphatidylserine/phosphatidylglycerophosphate/cardiolipin synthase family protein [Candidatus Dormibacteraeota bacterium]|nr:phosphatidylserine/phosphatidylglycerophosphate/cardiolipin synthase family protein [Candidatus Dormibacteraeota bacterium]